MREIILQEARRLFVEQGYAATSIKQIAQAAGCATSTLYYYFEEGKPQMLREVVHGYTKGILRLFQDCSEATSLPDLLQRFGTSIESALPEMVTNNSWLQVDFSRLSDEEKRHIRSMFASLHHFLIAQIERFVESEALAVRLAWMLVCTYIGYEQTFIRLKIVDESQVKPEDFRAFVTETLTKGVQK